MIDSDDGYCMLPASRLKKLGCLKLFGLVVEFNSHFTQEHRV